MPHGRTGIRRVQSLNSLMGYLHQDINWGFAFRMCLNGTFPLFMSWWRTAIKEVYDGPPFSEGKKPLHTISKYVVVQEVPIHTYLHILTCITSFILDIDVHSEIGYGWFKANLVSLNDLPQNGLWHSEGFFVAASKATWTQKFEIRFQSLSTMLFIIFEKK